MVSKDALRAKMKANVSSHNETEVIENIGKLDYNFPIDKIKVSPYQPRIEFLDENVKELAESIKVRGLITPIRVRKTINGEFELISGENRLRACVMLGKSTIMAQIVEVDDLDASLDALADNIIRTNLTDFEVYNGILAIKSVSPELKFKNIIPKLGVTRSDFYKFMRYQYLPENIIADLKVQPALLGRGALTKLIAYMNTVSKYESDSEDDDVSVSYSSDILIALNKAWEQLKNNEINQSALAETVKSNYESLIKAKVHESAVDEKSDEAPKNQQVFNFKSPNVDLKYKGKQVSLKFDQYKPTEDDLQKIAEFIESLINGK